MPRPPGDPRTLRAEPDAPVTVVRAGRVPYLEAWGWQRQLADRRARDEVGDVVLLLEHPRVYTMGRRADEDNLLFDADERQRRGIEVHRIDRGGDVTYHGPGQLVGYPVWRLAGPRVVDHVRTLEELNLRVLRRVGIPGSRVEGFSGVWVDDAKVTAVGVHVSARFVTTHGWATNVATDLGDFAGIVPCGITDKRVASLRSLGATGATVEQVADLTVDELAELLGAPVVDAGPAELGLGLASAV